MAWRHSLLAAYATMRARRPGFGPLAARALDQAVAVGGVEVALAGEAALVRALAPAAAAAGSAVAASILAPGTGLTLQLLGEVRLARHGETVPVPAGTAGALLRVLGPHRAGLDIDQIVDALRPDLDAPTGRRLVSRAASRLRSLTGVPVERHGTRLRLVGVWVDAVAFRDAADRALAGAGGLDPDPAAEAIALWSGELLPSDPYADWAAPERQRLRRRYLALLDLLAADAAGRKSLDEAARLLEEAIEVDPDDEGRYLELARCHLAADRRVPARRALERARRALLGLGLGPSGELLGLEAATDGDGPDRPGPG
jgi:DNA-binding SARP family transcriptional activator